MPSIIPGYEYDIFISYRQKDNKYDGWVTEFVKNLSKELEATFKEDISIYFDENPHDGLLETHNVSKSLEGKLRSLVFIPIISQTYCDPKSFAWQHEFVAFNEIATNDNFGKSIKLANGNVAERILPVQIHDLDQEDKALYESVAEAVLRPVDFIYTIPGVNRQLRAIDDDQIKNPDQILYRDQINKVAHAIKDIIVGLKNYQKPDQQTRVEVAPVRELTTSVEIDVKKGTNKKLNKKYKVLYFLLPLILIAVLGFYFVSKRLNIQKAKNELLPAIQKFERENFRPPTEAFDLAIEAEKHIANDSALINLWPRISVSIDMVTDPSGAQVYWKDYHDLDSKWRLAGTTPLLNVRFPRGYLRMEIRKEGYETLEYANRLGPDTIELKLAKLDEFPKNMVRIPKGKTYMNIVGLEQHGPKEISEFLIDKYEVSNLEYKKFIDAGGYTNKSFWQYPFISEGKEISFEEAMGVFLDKTARPGPANWEAGTYPDGEQEYPVAGVSWHEAAAYAVYAKKQLPTIYHWARVAATSRSEFIVPLSNYGGESTTAVGKLPGYSAFGVYDLAGNVREWCFNESTDGQRFILGGGWNEPTYSFNDAYMQPMLDRSITNGFRCIQDLSIDSANMKLRELVTMEFRDYKKEKPVDDATFDIMRGQFAYDKTPLDSRVEYSTESEFWTAEKISFNAGYNNERMEAYLYLPKNFKGPYQPILFFPGSGDIYSRKFNPESIWPIDFLLKSGRAIIQPIYKGTHERFDELDSDLPNESVFYKDHVIMWRKDIGRTLDYLETRNDIEIDKLGYLGWSWGGYMGGIMPAIEPRIKAVVLNVGGMVMNKSLPEVDQLNFLPRITQPVLMLNGKHDMFFPVETSQKPMFDFLGTPESDKKLMIFETGHLVPKTDFVTESLSWFDHYLGTVE